MPKSAGLIVYRHAANGIEVLLAHPGGPYFRNRDDGHWTVPKGLVENGESDAEAAVREFGEETSFGVTGVDLFDLDEIRQKGGKVVHAFACEGDFDPSALESNRFEMEWPPRSGRTQSFPEIDRVAWFDVPNAREKINPAQVVFLDRLIAALER